MRCVISLICLISSLAIPVRAGSIKVAAAISLRETLTDIAANYERDTHEHVELVWGSSGQLLAQIKGGAPIDLFISAADPQVDELIRLNLADQSSRRTVAGNEMVLIVPANSASTLKSFDALTENSVQKIAIGEPRTVPAGEYAMQVLKFYKLGDKVKDKLVYGTNVRQVLEYVERGEVSAGIVYATDAKEAGDKVDVVATASRDSHGSIQYPAVIIRSGKSPDLARKFMEHLSSEAARAALTQHGFTLPDAPVDHTPATRP